MCIVDDTVLEFKKVLADPIVLQGFRNMYQALNNKERLLEKFSLRKVYKTIFEN